MKLLKNTNMPSEKICAIHQPNFFPWLGYFDKIRQADVFILMDDVAYPKSGSGMGSWCNRVKLSVNNNPQWVGCPLQRYSGIKKIKEVTIQEQDPWRQKLLKTIEYNYKKSKHYPNVMEFIESLISFKCDNLSDFNCKVITKVTEFLGLNVQFQRQSELNVEGQGTQLLINLTKAVNCDTYLCGGGAGGYQQDELFELQGINLRYQNFDHPTYGDLTTFIPGLSILDYLLKADY